MSLSTIADVISAGDFNRAHCMLLTHDYTSDDLREMSARIRARKMQQEAHRSPFVAHGKQHLRICRNPVVSTDPVLDDLSVAIQQQIKRQQASQKTTKQ